MNLPNRLTLLRMVLVPFLVLFLLCDAIPFSYLWALLVFVAASLTDFFDGKIARLPKTGSDLLNDRQNHRAAFCLFIDIIRKSVTDVHFNGTPIADSRIQALIQNILDHLFRFGHELLRFAHIHYLNLVLEIV